MIARVGKRLTPDALAKQMARLEDAWGPPKDRTQAQFVGMTREWFLQLDKFGAVSVERAFTHVIGSNKFQWLGAIVEIVAFCTKDDTEWRDALGLKDEKRFIAEAVPFEREGRTPEEEIKFRAGEIAAMKRETGFGTSEPIEGVLGVREIKLASQDQSVSAELLYTCAARRARRLPTCEENCGKRDCRLRSSERDE